MLRVTVRVGLVLREMDTAANPLPSKSIIPIDYHYERFAFKTVEATPPTANEVY